MSSPPPDPEIRTKEAEPQVASTHYVGEHYKTLGRWSSYWHQIDVLRRLKPTSILEIGIGNRTLSDQLRKFGFQVTTLDLDRSLLPDVQATILSLPFEDRSFDAVAGFEVLEHLPYEEVPWALREIHRVTARFAALSLPDASRAYRVFLQLPKVGDVRRVFTLPSLRKRVHRFDGQHYWEIGKDGYPLSRICQEFAAAGFVVRDQERSFEMPYHRFFTLARSDVA